jgi:hypothetical protein
MFHFQRVPKSIYIEFVNTKTTFGMTLLEVKNILGGLNEGKFNGSHPLTSTLHLLARFYRAQKSFDPDKLPNEWNNRQCYQAKSH